MTYNSGVIEIDFVEAGPARHPRACPRPPPIHPSNPPPTPIRCCTVRREARSWRSDQAKERAGPEGLARMASRRREAMLPKTSPEQAPDLKFGSPADAAANRQSNVSNTDVKPIKAAVARANGASTSSATAESREKPGSLPLMATVPGVLTGLGALDS